MPYQPKTVFVRSKRIELLSPKQVGYSHQNVHRSHCAYVGIWFGKGSSNFYPCACYAYILAGSKEPVKQLGGTSSLDSFNVPSDVTRCGGAGRLPDGWSPCRNPLACSTNTKVVGSNRVIDSYDCTIV